MTYHRNGRTHGDGGKCKEGHPVSEARASASAEGLSSFLVDVHVAVSKKLFGFDNLIRSVFSLDCWLGAVDSCLTSLARDSHPSKMRATQRLSLKP